MKLVLNLLLYRMPFISYMTHPSPPRKASRGEDSEQKVEKNNTAPVKEQGNDVEKMEEDEQEPEELGKLRNKIIDLEQSLNSKTTTILNLNKWIATQGHKTRFLEKELFKLAQENKDLRVEDIRKGNFIEHLQLKVHTAQNRLNEIEASSTSEEEQGREGSRSWEQFPTL